MKIIVAGGGGKKSGVISKLAYNLEKFGGISIFNGELPTDISGGDLVLWWPDIPNEIEKKYPKKQKGAVLICSKVMREDTTRIDAVSRIFRMQGNAVVLIYKKGGVFEFELVDALNNTWVRTCDLSILSESIIDLYKWSKDSKRRSLIYGGSSVPSIPKMEGFLEINRLLALKVAEGCGNRFFGNYSTRCTKLFPSVRGQNYYLFSPRNIDKRFVRQSDLVLTTKDRYFGNIKPSVDTPVQIELYENFEGINYMIHGHAFIKNAPFTNHYFPCGDLREAPEVAGIIENGATRINLKKHGFLLIGTTEKQMQLHLEESEFVAI